MNNLYIIPADIRSGRLIFNIFRKTDLILFATGLALSLLFFVAIPESTLLVTIIKLLPVSVCGFLVVPVPYYHNVLCFIREIYLFLANRRVYYWRGWCIRSEFTEKQ